MKWSGLSSTSYFSCVVGSYQSLLLCGSIRERFGSEIHFAYVGLLQHIHDVYDVLVFSLGGTADDHIQVRFFQAQTKQLVLQRGKIHLVLVQIHLAAAFDSDVFDGRFRVLRALGGQGEIHVEIIHNRRGGNDEDDQEHEGQIEQRGDVQLRQRLVMALGTFLHGRLFSIVEGRLGE